MKLVLLTAGEGTRLRPHTHHTPKPSVKFLDIPLAYYGLYLLKEIKYDEVLFNTYHLGHKVEYTIKQKIEKFKKSEELDFIRGSSGGLYLMKPHLENDDIFFMMNGDELILPEFEGQFLKALKLHRKENRLATLFTMKNPEVGTKFGGVWTSENDEVHEFGKSPKNTQLVPNHFIGVFIFSNRIFNYIPSDKEGNILYDSLVEAIKNNELVKIQPVQGLWYETGNSIDFNATVIECLDLAKKNVSGASNYLNELLKYYHVNLNKPLTRYLLKG